MMEEGSGCVLTSERGQTFGGEGDMSGAGEGEC